jgi:predicted phosphodiesterase
VSGVRYGVIADVHGNLPALEAAITALGRIGVDAYACAGDLVGYGPQPNECVEVVQRLGAVCVAGNHDLIALGTLSADRCERLARETLYWTREALDDASRAYLARLPRRAELAGGVVVAHGSLDDPQEYVLRVDQAATQLARLSDSHPAAGILVVGHTHRAFASDGVSPSPRLGTRASVALDRAERWLLNPGAVGQSRERRVRARFMVLDLERREAEFHAVRYDVRRSRALLRGQRLPTRSVHLAPWRPKTLLRPAIRAARRVGTGVRRP